MKKIHLLLLLSPLFFACRQTAPAPETEPAKTGSNQAEIILTDAQVQTGAITWSAVNPQSFVAGEGKTLSGELIVHPEHTAVIAASAEGVLSALRVTRNQAVQAGAVVAVLRRIELLDWQQELLETRARMPFLKAEYERYRTLKAADAGALKSFQSAEAEYLATQTRIDLLGAKLRAYGIDPDQLHTGNVRSEVLLRSPVSGIVTDIRASVGAALAAGQPICLVMDRSRMHADLWVYEKDLGAVQAGQRVQVQMGGTGPIAAMITGIDQAIDPERRAVRAHVEGRWPGHWVHGAFVTGVLKDSGTQTQQGWLLPADAIVQEAEGTFVFICKRTGGGQVYFQKMPVQAHPAEDNRTWAVPQDDAPAGAQIVQTGAYYVAAQGAGVEVEE